MQSSELEVELELESNELLELESTELLERLDRLDDLELELLEEELLSGLSS